MKIGIDCGSLTVKGALVSEGGKVLAREHLVHAGEVLGTVRKVVFSLLDGHDRALTKVALTGRHATAIAALLHLETADPVACEVAGSRALFGPVDHVLHLGGATLMLISLDPDGHLLGFTTNSACAAGTGSFLDEQAARMGLSHEDANAIAPVADPPSVATRCAVFAKTDLIHRQQEGFSRDQLWCGLCAGMSRTALQTLLKGRDLEGAVAVTGGVAANPGMVHYLRQALGRDVRVSGDSPVCAAVGAAIEGPFLGVTEVLHRLTHVSEGPASPERHESARRPALVLNRTKYPDFTVPIAYTDAEGNEVRIHATASKGRAHAVLLGIDVGSTSTKAAVCQPDGRVLLDVYRRTEGDPVGAGRKLLRALRDAATTHGFRLDVQAVGTTGSGRKIVGSIVGADLVVNEISAHVRGAVSVDPTVSTILEIGGQDSKYMRIQDGRIVDANMNYVCAAGTGTFVEELGRKLAFSLEEIGETTLGVSPPHTSDRCTVFMEQDAAALGREGVSRREVMAAVLYSVIENFRTKVVGNRPVSRDRVVFQGATARNKGLVAAIEAVFGVEVVVSPYCHVMGAMGAALLAAEDLAGRGRVTAFRGLGLADRDVRVGTSTCELCSNRCVISTASIEGLDEKPSFGYLCGREPTEHRMRRNEEYAPFRRRRAAMGPRTDPGPEGRPRVGIPLALGTWGYAPLLRTLVERLGCTPVFTPETDRETARLGASKVGSDFCFPVKVAHGHIAALVARDDLDGVLLPALIEEARNPHASRSRFCPYLEALPSVVRHPFEERPLGPALIAPIVDFNQEPIVTGRSIAVEMTPIRDVSPEEAAGAWTAAVEAQRAYQADLEAKGREILDRLHRTGRKAIVILGRPYNILDPVVSVHLPIKVSEMGFEVIPVDMLPFRPDLLGDGLKNMFWHYGQKILSACRQIAADPSLYGIFLTSFNCGPDSFILTLAEEVMGDKPFLELELDEHGSDGGYATRIEAFLDVVRARGDRPVRTKPIRSGSATPKSLEGRILWVPRMHPLGAPMFAAVLRGHGLEAQVLPESDGEAHSMGKAATRGSECTPMALTLGTFLKTIRDSGLPPDRHAFFMPDATGPCRFGAYALNQHLAMERLGLGTIPILSPSSENSYGGLPTEARKNVWDAILCGDWLFKLGCRVRPYERERGATDREIDRWFARMISAFETREDVQPLLAGAARAILGVPVILRPKPLVGVVGEIYVRCDPYANSRVVRSIEAHGGEAWLAPLSEWILYTSWVSRQNGKWRGDDMLTRIETEFGNLFIEKREHEYSQRMRPFLSDRMEPPIHEVAEAGLPFVPKEFEGESVLTIGRAIRFFEGGADLVVNAAPFGCMHGHISGAVFERLSREFGRPVVTAFYDATAGNQSLRSFVKAAARRRGEQSRELGSLRPVVE